MNEGLEYAQMLEIPVSTVSVVKKRSIFSRKAKPADELKNRVVDSVNERVGETGTSDPFTQTESLGGFVQTEDLTAPVKTKKKRSVAGKIIIGETVAACLLAAGIFLTNVFVPNTAINTFVGNLSAVKEKEASYKDFTLTSVINDAAEDAVAVTADGVLHFTQKASVYPVCDGKVANITQENGLYTVKIAHTSQFTSVFTGLDTVYSAVGDEVKSNIPFAYSNGETEVKVSMYDGETMLNCYTLSGAVPVWNS